MYKGNIDYTKGLSDTLNELNIKAAMDGNAMYRVRVSGEFPKPERALVQAIEDSMEKFRVQTTKRFSKEDTKMDFKVGDRVRATEKCDNDFEFGEGVIEVINYGDMAIRVTKKARFYAVGHLTDEADWDSNDNLELIPQEYDKEMQEALEESIDKHQKIVTWMNGQTISYLRNKVFMSDIVEKVFDYKEPACALCILDSRRKIFESNCGACILKKNFGGCNEYGNGYIDRNKASSGLEYLEAEIKLLGNLKACRVPEPEYKSVVQTWHDYTQKERVKEICPVEVGKTYMFRNQVNDGWSRIFKVTEIGETIVHGNSYIIIYKSGEIMSNDHHTCQDFTDVEEIIEIK